MSIKTSNIRYRCANCGFIFDKLQDKKLECPKCLSNACDKYTSDTYPKFSFDRTKSQMQAIIKL